MNFVSGCVFNIVLIVEYFKFFVMIVNCLFISVLNVLCMFVICFVVCIVGRFLFAFRNKFFNLFSLSSMIIKFGLFFRIVCDILCVDVFEMCVFLMSVILFLFVGC